MKKKKPLLPAQRRFLEYMLTYKELRPSGMIIKERIDTALKNGEYIIGGNYQRNFNRLRSDYIKDFHEFEQSTNPGSVPGAGWFDCEQSEF